MRVGHYIVVFGGNVNGALSDKTFLFDTQRLAWAAITTPPQCVVPRVNHQAVRLGNSIVVIGGRSYGMQYPRTVDFFDLRSKTWRTKPFVGSQVERERFSVTPVRCCRSRYFDVAHLQLGSTLLLYQGVRIEQGRVNTQLRAEAPPKVTPVYRVYGEMLDNGCVYVVKTCRRQSLTSPSPPPASVRTREVTRYVFLDPASATIG